MMVWDMKDFKSSDDMPALSDGLIYAFGIMTVDCALLGRLADACAQEGRYEFMLTVSPLVVVGGTGSPVNPIALF